jgi:hypothetical protein
MMVYEENYLPRFLPGYLDRNRSFKTAWQEYLYGSKGYAMEGYTMVTCCEAATYHFVVSFLRAKHKT